MANRFGDQEATQSGVNRFGDAVAAPPLPTPPGFGERLYEQTLQGPVELAKSLKSDPAGTLKQTAANLFGVSQYQTILKQLQAGQYLPAAISILSFKNPAQMQAEAMTTPAIEDVRTGNWRGLTGDVVGGVIALAGPKILSKVPGAARVTGAGVRAAAPDVAGGALKVGAGALMEHMLPGPSPLKYAFEGYTGYAGARQIGRGLNKGVAASRQLLRDRATAAAAALAKERDAAAPGGVQPVPAGALRALPEPATRMPPAADTSGVRSVPGEYAVRDPLPPSRQLAAPGRPAIITPAPDPLAGDTSGVRAVPAVYGTSATNEAAAGMREAMELQPGELAPPAGRTAPIAARASQIDQMARHMRAAGLTAADANLLDPPSLAPLAKNAGIEGPLGKVAVAVRKRIAAMEKAEAETAKIQAALDRLKPAERQVTESYRGEGSRFTRADEAPAVERKPPASETAAPTTAEQANVELGKSLSVEMPAEKPPALTKPQERINGLAAILADGPLSAEQLRGGLKSGGKIGEQQRLVLQQASEDAGLGKPKFSELDQIVDEVERIRAAAQREPWQMTRQEFIQTHPERTRKAIQAEVSQKIAKMEPEIAKAKQQIADDPGNPANAAMRKWIADAEARIAEQQARLSGPIASIEEIWSPEQIRWHHVEGALREGKPVPPGILAEYPELRPPTAKPTRKAK